MGTFRHEWPVDKSTDSAGKFKTQPLSFPNDFLKFFHLKFWHIRKLKLKIWTLLQQDYWSHLQNFPNLPVTMSGFKENLFSSKFWRFEPILVILGFWYRLQNFWKKFVKDCSPILGQIFQANFDFRIWVKSQSYDKPPWRNFVFLSKFG